MTKEPKKPGGIALRPSLWKRIERMAERQDKSRNEVVELILEAHVPAIPDFKNERINSLEGEDDTVETF